jgi:hypothetical protein
LKYRHDAINRARIQLFGAAGRLKSIELAGLFAGVQEGRELPDHCLLPGVGQDLFTVSSMVLANDRYVRMRTGEVLQCERFVPASGVGGALGGHFQDHRQYHQEACDGRGSQDWLGTVFLDWRRLPKMRIKVQVLNASPLAMCTPYGAAHHMTPATRKAGASVQPAVMVRQPRVGSHPRFVRNVVAVICT